MSGRRGLLYVAGAWVAIALVMAVVGGCRVEPMTAGGLSNMNRLKLAATAAATDQPLLEIDNTSAGAESLVIEDAGTPVFVIGNSGARTETGDQSVTGAWKLTGPTAAVTATPVARIGAASDVNDLLVIEKDGSPVVIVHNGGNQTETGNQTITGAWKLTGPTAAVTATPVARIGAASDVNDLLVVEKDGAVVIRVSNGGMLDVGLGSCSVADGDNDVCVAAVLEVDGELEADGAIDADSTSDFADTATFSKGSGNAISISAGGTLALAATADIDAGGYVRIGNGTPNGAVTAGNDEELYVEGEAEFDAEVEFDGVIDADSTSDFADTMTLSKGSGNALVIAAGGTISLAATSDIDASGYVAIGNGTPNGAVTAGNDEELYVEGEAEFDAEVEFDGVIDADSTSDFADTMTLSKGSGNALVVSAGGAAQFNGAVSLTQANGAGASANPVDYTATLGAMDGSDTFELFDVNITSANHTGAGNVISAMDFGLASPDAQVLEQAIVISDTDWDVAINTGDVPIVSRAMVWFEDFFGDALPDEIAAVTGTDPQAVALAIEANQAGGVATFSTGDDNAGGCATSCAGAVLGLHWSTNMGGTLIFETRIHLDGDITNKMLAVGFIDNAALEFPVTIGGSDARSWVSDDAVVFVYDSGADTDEWFALSRAGTTEGTGVAATGVAPAADTFQTLRIEVDQGGADARFYIDGVLVGTVTANAVTVSDLLSPIVIADTSEDAVQAVDVDYIAVWGQR